MKTNAAETVGVIAPQNLDAEADVVGAILFEGAKGVEASKRVVEAVRETGLTRSEFYWDVTHGLVYEAALSLVDRGEPSDRLAVVHELERTGQLEKVGGKVAVHELAAVVSTSANVCHHARLIREKARRRRERQFAMSLEHASLNGGLEADPGLRDELRGFLKDDVNEAGLRTRGVMLERVRPMRWLWARRIPMGLPSLIVGEEGVGKGTLTAWIVARATCGELDGDLRDEPVRVLIVGDEDSFEPIWVPRLYAAGADLTMLRTLDDGEYLDDLQADAEKLADAIEQEGIRLLLFDQLLDHVPGGSNGEAIYNPKNVRQAMLPLRRVAGDHGIAVLGLLHPIKANVSSFRQLIAGSHQFNAVSRSSLLLAADPEDEGRRVLVRGKGNHSAAPRSFEFVIAAELVELNGHSFEVPKVANPEEADRTVGDLLKAGPPAAPVRDVLAEELAALLNDEPQAQSDLARAVGRDPKDGTVRNALKWLANEGRAENVDRGKWKRPAEVQVQPLRGIALSTPDEPDPAGSRETRE